MGKWEMVRLGDVCIKTANENPSIYDKEIYYIDISSVSGEYKRITDYNTISSKDAPSRARQKVYRGDILVSTVRPNLNSVAIIDKESEDIIASTGFCVLRPDYKRIDNRYLFEFIKSPNFVLSMTMQATGASYPAVSDKIVMGESIPLPPLDVQQQIADVLDRASALIEKRRAQIDKLYLLVKSQFIEMFGDPVTNPMGWDVVALKTVCDVRDGTHDSPKYISEGFPLLTSKNFTKGYADFEDANYITEKDFQAINQRSKVDYGDIVMPMIGTIGSPVIVDTDRPFAIKNVALIKFNNSRIINVYLQALLSSYFLEYAIRQNNRGGTQKFIALGDIRRLSIPLPPISMQEDFIVFVHQVETQKSLLQQSLTKLELNYKSLMQKCFKGELFNG